MIKIFLFLFFSIQDQALIEFCEPGIIKTDCVTCNILTHKAQRSSIISLPQILIIQLKRFNYNHETKTSNKSNTRSVSFFNASNKYILICTCCTNQKSPCKYTSKVTDNPHRHKTLLQFYSVIFFKFQFLRSLKNFNNI